MKVYVINLLRSIDRLVEISRQFSKYNLSFERVEAIDGRKLEAELLVSDEDAFAYRCVTKSELGCNLSHIKALEMIANSDDEYGIILEDDAVLSSKCEYFFKNTEWIPKNTQLIKLCTGCKKVFLASGETINEEYKIYSLLSDDFLATGYLVSRDRAGWIAQKLRETNILVDVFLYDYINGYATELRPKQLYPAIIDIDRATNISTIDHVSRHHSLCARLKRIIPRYKQKCFLRRLCSPLPRRLGRIEFKP